MFLTCNCQLLLLDSQHSLRHAMHCAVDVQMYCYSPAPEIGHPQHTANDISSQRVKYQHLPYRLAICVQARC